jgi:hypothetical protein
MRAVRRFATWLLAAISRRSSADDRTWGQAMLRELDVIAGDRAAVSWALGAAAVLFRHSARRALITMLKQTGGIASGVCLGGAVFLISAGGLLRVISVLLPAWPLRSIVSAELLTAIVIPEIVCVAGTVALWRTRRFISTGVTLSGISLMIHFAMHVMTARM